MNRASIRRIANAGLLSLGVAALGACASESPTTPQVETPSFGFFPNGVGPILSANSNVPIEAFKVCKEYVGAVGPAVQILVEIDQGNNGSIQHSIPITVANGECWTLWEASDLITDRVTVTETVPSGYAASYVIQTVIDQTLPALAPSAPVAGNSASATIINRGAGLVTGVKVTFTNTFTTTPTGCTLTQGYWKTHAVGKKDAWPVASLTIGGIVYTKAELVAIMQAPTAGNGLLSLVQQLIAAKLNVIEGADDADIADEIAAADAMIDAAGGKIALGPPSSPFIDPATSSSLNNALTAFNEGDAGVPHCGD